MFKLKQKLIFVKISISMSWKFYEKYFKQKEKLVYSFEIIATEGTKID